MSKLEKIATLFVILAAGYWFLNPESNVEPLIVLVMSLATLVTSLVSKKSKPKKIPEYNGELDENFAHFVYDNQETVFFLEMSFDENQSNNICEWVQGQTADKTVWINVEHDECGTEFGFDRNDSEIHWNTRFIDAVTTRGYFKVHSIQGPYQGWMSVILKGVGMEHIKS
ncbi:hypothetical protein RDG65_002465 [Vibrio fluvialis]|nr:hypothetical protein [Vibrio fluvialis]MBY7806850.1 hypothetical protein [Vibrio fluvialis]MBY7944658.1 hypothetical protein [Vibrio fluvialis]